MNRVGLGLAIGAGYVLGRTRKLKLALAVGGVVAGKRMHLSPRAVADLVSGQLLNNPQFKEIGEQLREDLRGVGQAASGALVERQLDAFAERLHGRTAEVREQLSGTVPTPDAEDDEAEEPRAQDDEQDESEDSESDAPSARRTVKGAPAGSVRQTGKKSAQKAPAKMTAKKAAAKKTAAGRTAHRTAPAKRDGTGKSAAKATAGVGGSARGGRARRTKDGDGS
ncbi:DNA primase [Streptomyces sp. HD]|uniref:DNA primase n=1 Tax=Streptomyces sp. HD TaxID=3020892 RepID=UPI00232B4AF7|nr:DNA primase [Streptomyces sp. HD]MDC0766421.1 DNA primase [Streptomyces sp. HD]